jgi:CheY-like chemotaxis protein
MNQLQLAPRDVPVRILVVDDHLGTATTLARAISQLGPGVNVIPATSGQEALERVKHDAADILITDMIMPEMTGCSSLKDSKTTLPTSHFYFLLLLDVQVEDNRQPAACEMFTNPVSPERYARP